MIGFAYIAIEEQEYPIGNVEEVESLILELKPKMQIAIRWLGTLEVISVCDNTYFRMNDGIERKVVAIFCKRVS
jgi:hypothetical protein